MRLSLIRLVFIVVAAASMTSCAGVRPFSVATPGLQTMQEEEAQFFQSAATARTALGSVPLWARIDNTFRVYEAELQRARAAQGGFLNTTLNVLGLVLPVSGTVSAVALSDPDDVQTVAVVTGAATTAVMALNLLLRPGQKAAAAARCEAFLVSALATFEDRWGTDRSGVTGTDEEWATYLTMRSTLERGRIEACG